MDQDATPIVEMTGITKVFPGVKALSDVDFRLLRGEVHVLFGENGAGKSTLISILSGVYQPTSGLLKIDGQEVSLQSVHDAAKLGVGTVFQEFSLVPTLRVFENVYLGRELGRGALVDRRAMADGAGRLFKELGFEIDVRRRVSDLSRAEQQMVEIAKAFLAKARVLILDEPTASLTEKETRKLFGFIAKARSEGVGIIYISHRIQEFAEIADRISILRDGRMIGTVSAKNTSEQVLVELMTGRSIDKIYPEIARRGEWPGRSVARKHRHDGRARGFGRRAGRRGAGRRRSGRQRQIAGVAQRARAATGQGRPGDAERQGRHGTTYAGVAGRWRLLSAAGSQD